MIGKTVSHYKILEKLGGGGMGVVYKAEDQRLDREVALKFLPTHLSEDEEAKRRFIAEAKAASALDHPNICTIYEIDQTDDAQMFIAMAYYEGETLKKRMEREPLSLVKAIKIAIQIVQGLTEAQWRAEPTLTEDYIYAVRTRNGNRFAIVQVISSEPDVPGLGSGIALRWQYFKEYVLP